MHYVYDFDSTLFSTQRVWDVWRGMLIDAGYAAEVVDATGAEITPKGYSPRKHAATLGVPEGAAADLLARFAVVLAEESPGCVFEDVRSFIEARRDGHRQTILTQGDEAHQWEKLRASGVDALVPRVVITKPDGTKVAHLAEMLAEGGEITFIDDNPCHLAAVRESGLPIVIVRMARPSEKLVADPHELDGVAWRVISSLRELD